MPDPQEVVIVDAQGTEHVFPPGFNPKHAAAIVRNGGSSALPTKPVSAEDFTPHSGGVLQTAKDVGIGGLKGLLSTVQGLGDMAVNAGMVPGVTPAAFNPSMRSPVLQRAEQIATASNPAQTIGKVAEQGAEMLLPTGAAVNAVPRMGRAAEKFQGVMRLAKAVPVNAETPGQVALRIQELADRGATAPRVVGRFLRRVTDPEQAPLLYEEGRDWASNISRLSADEYNRMTPVIKREMGNLRTALNSSLGESAGQVGQRGNYEAAMKEYAQAAKLQGALDTMGKKAASALPLGLAGGVVGAGGYAAKKLIDLLMGGE